jgi:hypothetical protein
MAKSLEFHRARYWHKLDEGRETTRCALEHSLLYSEELDIVLAKRSDSAYFRWFLASLLFGARISETTAKNTYRSFVAHGLTNPEKILQAGWDFLVYPVMREGGYVRYDGRKSTQVLRDCKMLMTRRARCARSRAKAARVLRRRAGHREHLLARAAAVLGQGRSRSATGSRTAGKTSLD